MGTITANLQAVRARIADAAVRANRAPDSVQLLAVSKTVDTAHIVEAWHAGQRAFGENVAQEGVVKVRSLAHLDIEWHFIGPVQGNKTRLVAEHFSWVHSIDRLRIAQRLNDARPPGLPSLNVLIQVNVSGETSKGGVAPGDETVLAAALRHMPRLRLRGLMTIPEPTPDPAIRHARFARLRKSLVSLQAIEPGLDTLSMGMSDDLEAAIAEGATLVRVGTALFGARIAAKR